MAVTDTLTTIKEYFINWHKDNYNTIHNTTTNDIKEKNDYSCIRKNSNKNTTKELTQSEINELINTQICSLQSEISTLKSNYNTDMAAISGQLDNKQDITGFNYNRFILTDGTRTTFPSATDLIYVGQQDNKRIVDVCLYYNDYIVFCIVSYHIGSRSWISHTNADGSYKKLKSDWVNLATFDDQKDANIPMCLRPRASVTTDDSGTMGIRIRVNTNGNIEILIPVNDIEWPSQDILPYNYTIKGIMSWPRYYGEDWDSLSQSPIFQENDQNSITGNERNATECRNLVHR